MILGQDMSNKKKKKSLLLCSFLLQFPMPNAAVKKAFMEFGDVHTVFAGRYKEEEFQSICNGKRHIRLTPFKSKHNLPHEIQFGENQIFFHIMWAEKKIYCRKCDSVHMLIETCYGGQTDFVYKENGVTFNTRPQYPDRDETDHTINKAIVESMSPGYPAVAQGAPQLESSSRNSAIASTNDEPIVNLVVRQPGKSAQDNGSKIGAQSSWEDIPNELSQDQEPTSSD